MIPGDKIRKRRKELKIRPDHLAKKINKSVHTIYRYERTDPLILPEYVIEVLADELQVPTTFFTESEEYKNRVVKTNISQKLYFELLHELEDCNQKEVKKLISYIKFIKKHRNI